MEFKQYPSYKNSGVEWLGDVPEHWYIFKSNKIFKQSNVRSYESDEQLTASQKYGVIPQSLYMKKEESKVVLALSGIDNFKHVDKNDFVISLRSFQGGIELCFYDGCVSPAYTVLKPNKVINYSFWSYLFKSTIYISVLNTAVDGIREGKTISYTNFGKIYINIPPLSEQAQIANYLDTETARIDNLINKQQKLIELLGEQRKSIISYAVTKGLNPNAPMKDSGVEWLGEVPEHWMTPSSKHLLEIPITDGPHETPNFVDDGVPFISAEAISKGKIDFDKKRGYITPELNVIYSKKYSPKIEDIYMVKSGTTTGKVAMVEITDEFNIWSPLAVFRCNKNKVLPKFLLAVFNSSHFYDALVLNWSYGTQQNIGMGVLSNIEIPCPPIQEQADIIQYLDTENTKFDKLISCSGLHLKPLRTAFNTI
jgi:type I restriction enzyme S subunit